MNVLLDTNVLIDIFSKRQPWTAQATEIWLKNSAGEITGFVTASSLTDLFFLCGRLMDTSAARRSVEICLGHLEICTVSRMELEFAAGLKGTDFEDNLQIVCAENNHLHAIVTRDKTGFKDSPVDTLTPTELLARLNAFPKAP